MSAGEIHPEASSSSSEQSASSTSRVLSIGKSEHELSDNAVYTSKYTLLTFFPIVSVYVCVCMYACMCVYIYVCMCVCVREKEEEL